jgi:hypothetical protein
VGSARQRTIIATLAVSIRARGVHRRREKWREGGLDIPAARYSLAMRPITSILFVMRNMANSDYGVASTCPLLIRFPQVRDCFAQRNSLADPRLRL